MIKRKKRSPKEFARIYGSKARVEWVKSQPCYSCGAHGGIVNAHTETGGTGRKADFTTIIPLCTQCHSWQHAYGWQMPRLNRPDKRMIAAARTDAAWLASHNGEE